MFLWSGNFPALRYDRSCAGLEVSSADAGRIAVVGLWMQTPWSLGDMRVRVSARSCCSSCSRHDATAGPVSRARSRCSSREKTPMSRASAACTRCAATRTGKSAASRQLCGRGCPALASTSIGAARRRHAPAHALRHRPDQVHLCGFCEEACPVDAIVERASWSTRRGEGDL